MPIRRTLFKILFSENTTQPSKLKLRMAAMYKVLTYGCVRVDCTGRHHAACMVRQMNTSSRSSSHSFLGADCTMQDCTFCT